MQHKLAHGGPCGRHVPGPAACMDHSSPPIRMHAPSRPRLHSFQGQHLLVVDRADDTRTSLSLFIGQLQGQIQAQKDLAQASGAAWVDPQVGIFVLHNKRRVKAADLPAEVLDGR